MSTTYTKAEPGIDGEVLDLLGEVMRHHHPKLAEAGVRVGVLLAENPDGDAVTHGGYAAAATIKVVSLKDRTSKRYDAELLIDLRHWREGDERHQAALLDHELSHIDLVPLSDKELKAARSDDSSAPWWKLDDLGRPRLRTVKGDWNVGDAFRSVIARHGDCAVEYTNLARAKAMADAAKRGEV